MLVYLKYGFIFEPEETWPHLYEFEQSFAEYLKTIGLEATIIKAAEGQESIKMLSISKRPDVVINEPVKSIKSIKADLTKGRGYDGRFTK